MKIRIFFCRFLSSYSFKVKHHSRISLTWFCSTSFLFMIKSYFRLSASSLLPTLLFLHPSFTPHFSYFHSDSKVLLVLVLLLLLFFLSYFTPVLLTLIQNPFLSPSLRRFFPALSFVWCRFMQPSASGWSAGLIAGWLAVTNASITTHEHLQITRESHQTQRAGPQLPGVTSFWEMWEANIGGVLLVGVVGRVGRVSGVRQIGQWLWLAVWLVGLRGCVGEGDGMR